MRIGKVFLFARSKIGSYFLRSRPSTLCSCFFSIPKQQSRSSRTTSQKREPAHVLSTVLWGIPALLDMGHPTNSTHVSRLESW
jgi:hypothetical protein